MTDFNQFARDKVHNRPVGYFTRRFVLIVAIWIVGTIAVAGLPG